MQAPRPDPDLLALRGALLGRLELFLRPDQIIADGTGLGVFDQDGLTTVRQAPMAAVLPETAQEVSRVMSVCAEMGIKIVPRGAGTSLSGGAVPLADGVLLVLSRLDKITEIDPENRTLTCGPGVTNLAISAAVQHLGLYFAPDPSSQIACTIGGNVAENAGGVHCLKYGVTTNNLAALQFVTMDGTLLRAGGKELDSGPYDILGLLTGSEGLLAAVTEVTVRLLPLPVTAKAALAAFHSMGDAGRAVAAIIAAGIIPAGMEMMDRAALSAAEAFCAPGYPADAEAVLIIELDGEAVEVAEDIARVASLCREEGAFIIREAQDETERARFWAGRKNAFPAVGRLAPDYLCMDGTIPRSKIADVMAGISQLSAKHGLDVANVFHAGDGNLHPLIMFDAAKPGDLEAAENFGADILRLCVAAGGVLTGEHGVGLEKRDLMGEMFSDIDLAHQERIKCAFDPNHQLNPGKMFPVLHRCAELGRLHVHRGALPFPELPRF